MQTRVVHRGVNLEYLMWIYMRISGFAMITMAAIGMFVALFMGARYQMDLPTLMRWTFFPNPNHIVNSNIPDVAMGWANGFWQIMEILLVSFGVTHGFNGLRLVIEDFLNPTIARPLARGFIFFLWFFVLLAAIYVILAS